MRRWLLGTAALISIAVAGCPQFPAVCDYGACDTDGGVLDSSPDVVPDVAGCDLSKDPKDSPKCIDDAIGIFVSPTGSDTNVGTKAAPVATLSKALSLLGTHPRIYVCEGTYAGSVDIAKAVAVYGGLKCDWTPTGGHPVIEGDKAVYAVQVTAANVSLVDIDVTGKAGSPPGESSIGVFANGAQSLKLTRTKITAGVGVAGTGGTGSSNYTTVAQSSSTIAGNNASGITGGGPKVCTLCTDGKNSVGGAGGTGGAAPGDGTDGTPNLGGSFPNDGKAGTKDMGAGCTSGHKGAAPPVAGASASAPTSPGTLDGTGWKPANGGSGTNGGPAQGGGGGGGGIDGSNTVGGGGGGGCGGCGGGAGSGGTGGGSSIAILSFNSTITLTTSELASANAGNGGAGAAGQAGQLGGFSGSSAAPGCLAGTGGTGAAGGSGAGGSGGLSVAILYKGAKPTTDTATDGKIAVGTKGNKGIGGSPGINDGVDGVAQAVLLAP